MNCTLLTIDDDDEGSKDKDAHIRNGETVPKQLEAPPLGQTLGLKRFIATEFSAVFNVNTSSSAIQDIWLTLPWTNIFPRTFCVESMWSSEVLL